MSPTSLLAGWEGASVGVGELPPGWLSTGARHRPTTSALGQAVRRWWRMCTPTLAVERE